MACVCFKDHTKMEYQKIINLFGTTIDDIPRFITTKWVKVQDQLGTADDRYKSTKQIRLKTSTLRSDLCDSSYAYIVVKGDITLTKSNGRGIIDITNRSFTLKKNPPFTSCISKINDILIDTAEDLDNVMPMYILLEYCTNYRKTTGNLWDYYRDELITLLLMMMTLLPLVTMQTP